MLIIKMQNFQQLKNICGGNKLKQYHHLFLNRSSILIIKMAKKTEEGVVNTIFFECNISDWNKKFSTKKALNEHKRTHKGARQFQCEIWEQKFTQFSSLQKHGRVHDKKKPFKCDHEGCSSAFSQVSNLIRHKRIHTGEKPYKWDKWKKSFASGSNLKQHRLTHSSVAKRKVFKWRFCEDDSKNYLYQSSLRKHMQLNHRDEYEKLCWENEVDKSSVLKTMKGQVFMIEVVDKENQSGDELEENQFINNELDEEKPKDSMINIKPKQEIENQEKIGNNYPKKLANRIIKESYPSKIETRHRMLSRENSYVKQSSMLSEMSQSLNANNLAEYFDKNGFTCDNYKQDSFYLNSRWLRNSSFISNGVFQPNNSFMIAPEARYGGHMHDMRISRMVNDKYFDGIDEDPVQQPHLNPHVSSMHQIDVKQLSAFTDKNSVFGVKDFH